MKRNKKQGFTVVEIIVAIGILGILASLVLTTWQPLLARFEKVGCMANLRTLHVGLAARTRDESGWPQVPEGVEVNSQAEEDFWRETLEPYGVLDKNWTCPTLRRNARSDKPLRENHYVVTLFDPAPATPYRWPNMPWAMEIGNNHGNGLLVIMTDGSIHPLVDPTKQNSAR